MYVHTHTQTHDFFTAKSRWLGFRAVEARLHDPDWEEVKYYHLSRMCLHSPFACLTSLISVAGKATLDFFAAQFFCRR